GKRRLRGEILAAKGMYGGGAWCIIGDFNAVLNSDERRGIAHGGPIHSPINIVEFDVFV
ncbi:hypothetical protein A2U01_0077842, partial [Trifolium medium]|nr:hypothetical protein [Trifolium medium]